MVEKFSEVSTIARELIDDKIHERLQEEGDGGVAISWSGKKISMHYIIRFPEGSTDVSVA